MPEIINTEGDNCAVLTTCPRQLRTIDHKNMTWIICEAILDPFKTSVDNQSKIRGSSILHYYNTRMKYNMIEQCGMEIADPDSDVSNITQFFARLIGKQILSIDGSLRILNGKNLHTTRRL